MKTPNAIVILFSVLLFASRSGAEWDEARQAQYNEKARTDLRQALTKMDAATEVSVYELQPHDEGKPDTESSSRRFHVDPEGDGYSIFDEVVLRGAALRRLRKGWAELGEQDYYMEMRCHFAIYGLRFRDAKGHVLFETSLCWMCSNYDFRTAEGYKLAALPMRFLGESQLRKQLDELFSGNKRKK